MKKSIPILVLLFSFLIVSCETESSEFTEIEKTDLTLPVIELGTNIEDRGPIPCSSEESLLERQLHWFSFIAADVLYENDSAQQEVALYLSNNPATDNINAADLIGSNSLLGFSNFSSAFYDTLLAHLQPGWPTQGGNSPPMPTGQGGFMPGQPEDDLNLFYNDILLNNCVELYFPKGVNFAGDFNLTSSAHPLTHASCNEAYFVELDPDKQSKVKTGIEIDQNYVNTHNNVLIARPFRTVSPACLYLEYGGINFEDFMD